MIAAHDTKWTGEDTQTALARLLALISAREALPDLLNGLMRFAEMLNPDMRCSVLLADSAAGVLRAGAAPSLPPAYVQACDNLPIADGTGSCGTAAARRSIVIVSDIARSPLWRGYSALAAAHGLGACWSVPLIGSSGELLGTCAMYYSQPRTPTQAEADLIRITGSLASMVIQRHRDSERLTASEARYRLLAAELQQARADLQAVLDNVPAHITSWTSDGTNRFANRVAEKQFGISAGEAVGRTAGELLGAEVHSHLRPYIQEALKGIPQSRELVETLPDGLLRHLRAEIVPNVSGGEVVGIYAMATDVTELRNSYERIRELAQRVETVREEERRSIAHALHEGIAQELFAIKLGLDNLRSDTSGRPGFDQVVRNLTTAIEKCMADTRQVANDLLPTALAHLRVSVGIGQHARYFSGISGLQIDVTELAPFPQLDERTRLVLFRAAQEALTNVARHAQATHVNIVLSADTASIRMEVTDDGIGIPGDALAKSGSLGLFGIQERVSAIGGSLTMERMSPTGTRLLVSLPLPA